MEHSEVSLALEILQFLLEGSVLVLVKGEQDVELQFAGLPRFLREGLEDRADGVAVDRLPAVVADGPADARVVPTVERGLRALVFCSMAIAGLIPCMKSTSGLSIRSRNWRA
jgi:hypothetical protein